jgi:hypothetical protein
MSVRASAVAARGGGAGSGSRGTSVGQPGPWAVGASKVAVSSSTGSGARPIIVFDRGPVGRGGVGGVGGGTAAVPRLVIRASRWVPVPPSSKRSTCAPRDAGRSPTSPRVGTGGGAIGAVVRLGSPARGSGARAGIAGTPAIGVRLRPVERRLRMRSRDSACSAAPCATASSGWMSVRGARWKNCVTRSRTWGILVVPPTSTTSSTALALSPARVRASAHTVNVRSISGAALAMS